MDIQLDYRFDDGTISQIIPRRMKTLISTRTAVPRVATVRKASLGDRSMARVAVLRSPKAQEQTHLDKKCFSPAYRISSSLIASAESCAASWTPVCAILMIVFA